MRFRPRMIGFLLLAILAAPGCRSSERYEGERINIFPWSYRHGTGTYVSPEGWTYTGEWNKDKREGYGTCTYPDGDRYAGWWYNDKRHGNGEYTWRNGVTLKGVWKEGELSELRR